TEPPLIELNRRERERLMVDHLLPLHPLALEAYHPLGHPEPAEARREKTIAALAQHLQDFGVLLGQRRWEVVEVGGARQGPVLLEPQLLDQVLSPAVQVDRPGVALV